MPSPGRKPTPTAAPVGVKTNPKALAKAGAALTEMSLRSSEVSERFGDGLPYERERVISTTVFFMGQASEAALAAGKMLIQLKENEPWGEYSAIVEKRLGLEIRTAQRMMNLAVKYLSPALAGNASTLTHLGRSKLLDLMVESDDDLAELAEGGTVAGLTLDDMHSMSVRELREALAESRQTLTSRQKLLDKANAKSDRLQEKLDKPFVPNEDVAVQTAEELHIVETMQTELLAAQTALMHLGALVKDIDTLARSDELRQLAANNMEYLAQIFAQVLVEGGIAVQFEEMANPTWLKKAGKKPSKGG